MAAVPCNNCTERRAGCHGTCERYKGWKAEREAWADRKNAEKKKEQDVIDYQLKAVDKVEKARKMRKRTRRRR